MHDFEKNRIEHVQNMEMQVKSLQNLVNELQANAKWTPQIGLYMEDGKMFVAMEYHGRRKTITVPLEEVRSYRVEDLTTAVTQAFLGDLVFDGLRNVFTEPVAAIKAKVDAQPEVSSMSTLSR